MRLDFIPNEKKKSSVNSGSMSGADGFAETVYKNAHQSNFGSDYNVDQTPPVSQEPDA